MTLGPVLSWAQPSQMVATVETAAARQRPQPRPGLLAMPTLTAPHWVAPEEMVFHMSLLSLMVPVATQHQPRPRPRSAMPTLTATHMVALEEAELGSATVATQHRPRPRPRSAAIPRPPKVTLLLDLGFPFPSGPMLPVRPTQL